MCVCVWGGGGGGGGGGARVSVFFTLNTNLKQKNNFFFGGGGGGGRGVDGQTDEWPTPICPFNFFEVWGITMNKCTSYGPIFEHLII